MSKLEDLIFSHSEIANYGQASSDITTLPGGKVTLTGVPTLGNNILFFTNWRATGVTTSTVWLSFKNIRGWDGNRVLLVTANMGRDNKVYPYIICKGSEIQFTVEDVSGGAAQVLSLCFDYFTVPNTPTIIKKLEKYVGLNFKV